MKKLNKTLAILALIFAVLLWPVGLILAIITLVRSTKSESQEKILAVIAIIVSIVWPIFMLGLYLMSATASMFLNTVYTQNTNL